MILLNDDLTIKFPCEQGSQENLFGKRIFWFFNGCPCDCFIIRKIKGDVASIMPKSKNLWVIELLFYYNILPPFQKKCQISLFTQFKKSLDSHQFY